MMVSTKIKGKVLKRARRLLKILKEYLDSSGIEYHLEGGTLLGLVRDGEFLEWDYDIDISIPSGEAHNFMKNRLTLWLRGYRFSYRKSKFSHGPIREGDVRILKVKDIFSSFLAIFSPWVRRNLLVADVFLKFDDGSDVFWIAKDKVMKVGSHHYRGFETIEYNGNDYKVPLDYEGYLTAKYGDWSKPVKEWNCAIHERTIISRAV
jgi:hypothetical protein